MPAVTEASAMARAMQGTGGGIALGAGYGAVGAATGFNPLSVMPDPLHAALYGGFIFNPVQAMRMAKQGIFGTGGFGARIPSKDFLFGTGKWVEAERWGLGKGLGKLGWERFQYSKYYQAASPATTRFGGMLGYRTLLLGVQPGASIAARASIGNIMLSGIQALGQSVTGDWAKHEYAMVARNAKKLGLAGMANLVSAEPGGKIGKGLTESKLYKMAGIDVSKAKLVASGIEGKSTVEITKGLMKQGLQVGATSAGARVFSAALGMYSTFAWFELFGGIAKAGGTIAMEGVGEAARSFFQYVNEIQRPEFGKGRLNVAMQSAGAATERQRAVRASYGSKINPTNRLFGTEAMYHHSR